MEQKELYRKIAENVVEMEDEVVESLCRQSLEDGYDAADTINGGLIPGMNRVSELYEEGEYYLPEVLTASFALNAGVDVLKPHLKQEQSSEKLRVVIGVVEGDTHDIGKNLVKIMTESAGIEGQTHIEGRKDEERNQGESSRLHGRPLAVALHLPSFCLWLKNTRTLLAKDCASGKVPLETSR